MNYKLLAVAAIGIGVAVGVVAAGQLGADKRNERTVKRVQIMRQADKEREEAYRAVALKYTRPAK